VALQNYKNLSPKNSQQQQLFIKEYQLPPHSTLHIHRTNPVFFVPLSTLLIDLGELPLIVTSLIVTSLIVTPLIVTPVIVTPLIVTPLIVTPLIVTLLLLPSFPLLCCCMH
jgi:hypothetical protein